MPKPVGFALIGAGRISRKHVHALQYNLPDAKLIAVCDINLERAKSLGLEQNVPYYTDFHNMLRHEPIDVVNILTPSGLHAKHVIEVAHYKKHIVVEKPIALRLDDADQMITAAAQNGIKLFVIKQNRYNLPIIKLKEAIDANRFGKLILGTVRMRWCRDQTYYNQSHWRGTRLMDGGVFANQASHHIDLLEWMLGDVDSVYAKASTHLVNIEVENTGLAILKFKNGALGMIEATTATRPKDLEGSISILGEKASVEISGFAADQIKTWNFTDPHPMDTTLHQFAHNPPDIYGFAHSAYLQNVIDCIQGKTPALVNGDEAKRSLAVINAIYQSIDTHQEIFLNSTLATPIYSKKTVEWM